MGWRVKIDSSPHTLMTKDEIIQKLNEDRNWHQELLLVSELYRVLNQPSVRDLADQIKKSKSWVADSLYLLRGLRAYPELVKEHSRYYALTKLRIRIKMNKKVGFK